MRDDDLRVALDQLRDAILRPFVPCVEVLAWALAGFPVVGE